MNVEGLGGRFTPRGVGVFTTAGRLFDLRGGGGVAPGVGSMAAVMACGGTAYGENGKAAAAATCIAYGDIFGERTCDGCAYNAGLGGALEEEGRAGDRTAAAAAAAAAAALPVRHELELFFLGRGGGTCSPVLFF